MRVGQLKFSQILTHLQVQHLRMLGRSRDNIDQLVRFWEIGTQYLLFHCAAMVGATALEPQIGVPASIGFAAGILGFSGSIFMYVLTNNKVFQYMTPFGGMAFMLGWGVLAVAMSAKSK
eukprot:TRINITY_DN846_c1_g1_i1.p3 TRINITY_DN846_c1_g1~~TRINITY_DN846_c1_g1_i1.p3  ORF type:complete len:119 (-),score=0.30 TRINITY_DN846_c1_g1_i1:449-805(-)